MPKIKLMGILNLSPNSFSNDGKSSAEEALAHAKKLLHDGADLLDIGAQSTAPGAHALTAAQECSMMAGSLKTISTLCQVSVDTYKSEVAEFSLRQGAQMINDVSGLRADPDMVKVLRKYGAPVVIMHSKESPNSPIASNAEAEYSDIIGHIGEFFLERIDYALAKGLKREQLIIDPGMGMFLSSKAERSLEVLRRLDELQQLGLPILVGISRKGFLGDSISRREDPIQPRDPLSALCALKAALKGAQYIRTHNVHLTRRFIDTWKALD